MRRDLIGETLLNQFRVETFLASGGMATIYRVWDLQRTVPLAMKVLNPELAEDPSFIARFRREADSLRLLVHPHIVPFYGLYQEEELSFLLERYIDGPSLDELLRARAGRPLGLGEALVYFKALYTSLGYAHAQGIIHCDVKPGNVLIDQGGHVYLTDFGIARFVDSATTTSSALGTPLYMAPEQIRGERVSPQSDIYSLGVVMFELLTGQRPFRGDAGVPEGVSANPSDRIRYQHLYMPPPDPRSINPSIPEGVARVILQAMAKEPSARFASVGAMAGALEQTVAARFDSLPDRVSLPAERRKEWSTAPEGGPGAAWGAQPPGGVGRSETAGWGSPLPPATLPGAPPRGEPFAERRGAPAIGRTPLRRALLLGGLLALAVLCLLAGRQLAGAFGLLGRETAQAPLPGATSTDTPEPEASGTPERTAQPTGDGGLSDFPVTGEIAVVRHENGTTRLFLFDAGSGEMAALPGVPNVNEREISAPQWSPDGQRLAWIGNFNGKPHVVAMDIDEREPYQLPAGERYNRVSSPAFLPGGRQLSFWANNNGGPSLLVTADAVTGELVEETELPGYRNMFVWNWTADRLAFVHQPGGPFQVSVSDSAAGDGQKVNPGGEGYAPAWSNDGAWIAFQSDQGREPGMNEVWVARPDGSEARAVTGTPPEAWSRAPTWSPDGRRIAFVSNRSGSRGADFGELFVVDLESGETRQVTDTGGSIYDWRPAWRP